MAETSSERLERIIREQKEERAAAITAAEEAKRESLSVDKELRALNKELKALTDEELKTKDRDFLQQKLAKAKELEKEKLRRSS
jgi:hypothetical protein